MRTWQGWKPAVAVALTVCVGGALRAQAAEPVVRIGETGYATLAEAFAVTEQGVTLTVLRDFESPAVTVPDTFSGTLDFAGHTVTCAPTANFLTNNGTLTLTNSADGSGGIVTTPPAELSVRPGKTQIVNNGTLSVTGGTYSASTTRWLLNIGTVRDISGKTTVRSGDYNVIANNAATAVIERMGGPEVRLYAENTTLTNATGVNGTAAYPAQVVLNNLGEIRQIEGGLYDASGCAQPASGGAFVLSESASCTVREVVGCVVKGAYMGINAKRGTIGAIQNVTVESAGAALAVYAATVTNPVTGCTFTTTDKDPTVFLGANTALTLEGNTLINTTERMPAVQNGGASLTLTGNTLVTRGNVEPLYVSFQQPLGASDPAVGDIHTYLNEGNVFKVSATGDVETAAEAVLAVYQQACTSSGGKTHTPRLTVAAPNVRVGGEGGELSVAEGSGLTVYDGEWVLSKEIPEGAIVSLKTLTGETFGFTDFETALAVAKDGETLTLLKDVELTETPHHAPQAEGGTVSLDVDTFTFKTPARIGIPDSGIRFVRGCGVAGWYNNTSSGHPTTVYPTFAQAVDSDYAVPSMLSVYSDVTLGEDVTLKSSHTTSAILIDEGYDVTFDLNGHTLEQQDSSGWTLGVFRAYGDFTLKDSSEEGAGTVIAGVTTGFDANGAPHGTGGLVLLAVNGAQVSLQGGTLTDHVRSDGSLNESGIIQMQGGALKEEGTTRVTLEGAEILCNNGYALVNFGGELNLVSGSVGMGADGGPYASYCSAAYGTSATVTVGTALGKLTGAVVTADNDLSETRVNKAYVQFAEEAGVKEPIPGEGLVAVGSWVLPQSLPEGAVAMVSSSSQEPTTYPSLAAAFAAVAEGKGDTVTALASFTEPASATATQPLRLHGNGQTIALANPTDAVTFQKDVTFSGVTLVAAEGATTQPVHVEGDVRLRFAGANTVTGGIAVPTGASLAIQGDSDAATLEADASAIEGAAGIGGNAVDGLGAVSVVTGAVTARAGLGAAGIGEGFRRNEAWAEGTGEIAIAGGNVTAFANPFPHTVLSGGGAGIGGAARRQVKSIAITGGAVKAHGDKTEALVEKKVVFSADGQTQVEPWHYGGAGIGTGTNGGASKSAKTVVSITGGTVYAQGGMGGAGIGGGEHATAKPDQPSSAEITVPAITIGGDAKVHAVGLASAAGIGSGDYGNPAITPVLIEGNAEVIAEAVGMMCYNQGEDGSDDVLTNQLGTFKASGKAPGAGIGGGYNCQAWVTIRGNAKVLAISNGDAGEYAHWGQEPHIGKATMLCGTYVFGSAAPVAAPTGAAIGTGRIPTTKEKDLAKIEISGAAQVWAYGGDRAAGIGGGHDVWTMTTDGLQGGTPQNFPPIAIGETAQVVAIGGLGASGIGGGCDAQNGSLISVASTARVTATAGAQRTEDYTVPAPLGLGSYCLRYRYSPTQSRNDVFPATQPTTTLRVTVADGGATPTVLPIVTRSSGGDGDYVNLSDSPGLAIQIVSGDSVQAVPKTTGAAEGNELKAADATANPIVRNDRDEPVLELSKVRGMENQGESLWVADPEGRVMARIDSREGAPKTIEVLDKALTIDGKPALITKTGAETPTTHTENALEMGVLLKAAFTLVEDGTKAHDLEYVYDFGIVGVAFGLQSAAEGTATVNSVTIGLTEGQGEERTKRTVTLNGTLKVFANDGADPILTLAKPAFRDGQCVIAPASGKEPEIAFDDGGRVRLTVKLTE